jgi:DNA-binding response OmpR family regulator
MSPQKILLIEDDPEDADIISGLLKEKGYIINHTASGREGLKKAKTERYDLIILDLILPDLKGEAICACLKRDIRYRKIPIMIVSIKDEIDEIEDLFALGADDYIIKPFHPHRLLKKIAERLSSTDIRA